MEIMALNQTRDNYFSEKVIFSHPLPSINRVFIFTLFFFLQILVYPIFTVDWGKPVNCLFDCLFIDQNLNKGEREIN